MLKTWVACWNVTAKIQPHLNPKYFFLLGLPVVLIMRFITFAGWYFILGIMKNWYQASLSKQAQIASVILRLSVILNIQPSPSPSSLSYRKSNMAQMHKQRIHPYFNICHTTLILRLEILSAVSIRHKWNDSIRKRNSEEFLKH